MSISGVGSGSFFNPFGILVYNDDSTSADSAAATDQTGAATTTDTTTTAAPAAPVPQALGFTNLLDAVRQLTGGLNLPAPTVAGSDGSSASASTPASATSSMPLNVGQQLLAAVSQATGAAPVPTTGSDASSANNGVVSQQTTIQSRLHQLFQQLADATASGVASDTSTGAASDGSGMPRAWGGHHHHHHRAGGGETAPANGCTGQWLGWWPGYRGVAA